MLGTSRPKNNSKEIQNSEKRLALHFELMNKLMREGMSKEEADIKAYSMVTIK